MSQMNHVAEEGDQPSQSPFGPCQSSHIRLLSQPCNNYAARLKEEYGADTIADLDSGTIWTGSISKTYVGGNSTLGDPAQPSGTSNLNSNLKKFARNLSLLILV